MTAIKLNGEIGKIYKVIVACDKCTFSEMIPYPHSSFYFNRIDHALDRLAAGQQKVIDGRVITWRWTKNGRQDLCPECSPRKVVRAA